jgi:indole-3-glycerol phosphate synthase
MVGNILDKIVADKRRQVREAKKEVPERDVLYFSLASPPPRDFFSAVTGPTPYGIHLIAEIKQRSPSAGVIREDFDPPAIARIYHEAGASAISVLTDGPYFGGRLEYLHMVRKAAPLPILRKDFILDAYQVHEARAAGADAVLFIAEVLGPKDCVQLAYLCTELGMTALVEAYRPELLDTIYSGFGRRWPSHVLVGINNRDLTVQKTDLTTTQRVASQIADTSVLVSESGIRTRADVEFVQKAGARAMLVGEAIMAADDMAGKIRELLGAKAESEPEPDCKEVAE